MAQRFVFVRENLWTDRKFLDLSTDARLLFMWSWMPPHSTVCGLYRCSLKQLGDALGASQLDSEQGRMGRVRLALDELESAGMIRYDARNEVLWVVNRVKHAATSAKAVAYMQREVLNCPDSPLVDEFLSRYGRELQMERVED